LPAGTPAARSLVSACGGGLVTNATVWANWNSGLYCAGTTTTSMNIVTYSVVWANWISTAASTMAYGAGSAILTAQVWAGWNTAWTETREQAAARSRLTAQLEARQAARLAEERTVRVAVEARAEQLLFSLLSDEQARTFREDGWFEVRGSRGRRWRIRRRGQAGNVDLMPETGNEREATFCAHPPDRLPDCDAYIAQMLHLVTDEDDFMRVANRHWERPAHRLAARVTAAGSSGRIPAPRRSGETTPRLPAALAAAI